jgi:hypothetical protein
MNNKMENAKQSILDAEKNIKNEELRLQSLQTKHQKLIDKKIKKFESYIKESLKDCHDKHIEILDNKYYGNIIAFSIDRNEDYYDFYYVRIEVETWEDRGSDESPLETYSKCILGLYPDGWGTKPVVSCDIPTKYYEYLEENEFKKKIEEFIQSVYKFFARESLKLGRTV